VELVFEDVGEFAVPGEEAFVVFVAPALMFVTAADVLVGGTSSTAAAMLVAGGVLLAGVGLAPEAVLDGVLVPVTVVVLAEGARLVPVPVLLESVESDVTVLLETGAALPPVDLPFVPDGVVAADVVPRREVEIPPTPELVDEESPARAAIVDRPAVVGEAVVAGKALVVDWYEPVGAPPGPIEWPFRESANIPAVCLLILIIVKFPVAGGRSE
jgi:hypothetical protein